MPHREDVVYAPWVNELWEQDPCLGRIVIEAVVARQAALKAGANKPEAPRSCRRAFESAETTLDAVRLGKVAPGTDAAWRRASDALRKYTTSLDCAAAPPSLSGIGTGFRAERPLTPKQKRYLRSRSACEPGNRTDKRSRRR